MDYHSGELNFLLLLFLGWRWGLECDNEANDGLLGNVGGWVIGNLASD